MHKQSQIVLGWHLATSRLMTKVRVVPPWVRLTGILVLVMISAGQTGIAQAQNRMVVEYQMVIGSPSGNICFHEHVNYTVHIFRKIIIAGDKNADIAQISNVDIKANIKDPSLITAGNSNLVQTDLSDPEALEPFIVSFPMTAQNKVGTTSIVFDAVVETLPTVHLREEIQVKVESCKIRVSWANNWGPLVTGTGGSIGVGAHFDDAVLTADDKGHFSGKAQATWAPSVSLPAACAPQDSIRDTDVDIQGDLDKNGLLVLTLTFKTASLEEYHTCGDNKHTSNALAAQKLKVPPLTLDRISKPVAQNLRARNSISLPGTALVRIGIDRND